MNLKSVGCLEKRGDGSPKVNENERGFQNMYARTSWHEILFTVTLSIKWSFHSTARVRSRSKF